MGSPQTEKDAAISQEEADAVRGTWSLVAKDLKGNGVKWFLAFFNTYPEYQKKFRGFADVPVFELAHNKRLHAHAFTVMNSINGLIDNLDDPEVLFELLIKIGQNHSRRKLAPSDFENVKSSLLGFMGQELGDLYTPTAASGWDKVFAILVSKVSEGLKLAQSS